MTAMSSCVYETLHRREDDTVVLKKKKKKLSPPFLCALFAASGAECSCARGILLPERQTT